MNVDIQLPRTLFLCGKMGVGKDYVAAQFVERGYTRLAFADALKREAALHLGITVAELNARKAEFRFLLQDWGTDRRKQEPDYWVRRWAEARALIDGPVVNTDTRFPNEASYALESGGFLVRLNAPLLVRKRRLMQRDGDYNPAWSAHIGETGIDLLPAHADLVCVEQRNYVEDVSIAFQWLMLRRGAALGVEGAYVL